MKATINPSPLLKEKTFPRLMTPSHEGRGRNRIVCLFLNKNHYICVADTAAGKNTIGVQRKTTEYYHNLSLDYVDFEGEITLSNDG